MGTDAHRTARYAWRDLFNVPSLVSLLRAPLALAFVFLAARPAFALGVLGLAGLTDVLDGWYARRYAQCTATGALVDGITDKVFALAVAGTLWYAERLSVLDLLLLGARDLCELAVTSWVVLRRDRHALHEEQRANALGKLTTCAQFLVVSLALFEVRHFEVCVATGVLGVLTAASYARRAA